MLAQRDARRKACTTRDRRTGRTRMLNLPKLFCESAQHSQAPKLFHSARCFVLYRLTSYPSRALKILQKVLRVSTSLHRQQTFNVALVAVVNATGSLKNGMEVDQFDSFFSVKVLALHLDVQILLVSPYIFRDLLVVRNGTVRQMKLA